MADDDPFECFCILSLVMVLIAISSNWYSPANIGVMLFVETTEDYERDID